MFPVLMSASLSSLVLPLSDETQTIIRATTIIALLIQAGIWGHVAVTFFVTRYARRRLGTDATSVTTISALGMFARLVIISVVVLLILHKPFVMGDFVIVDDLLGTVEHVGLKTTRIRRISGEQLVFSNNDLLQSRRGARDRICLSDADDLAAATRACRDGTTSVMSIDRFAALINSPNEPTDRE